MSFAFTLVSLGLCSDTPSVSKIVSFDPLRPQHSNARSIIANIKTDSSPHHRIGNVMVDVSKKEYCQPVAAPSSGCPRKEYEDTRQPATTPLW